MLYEILMWTPVGSARDDPIHDMTRPADEMDANAAFLLASGAQALEDPNISTEPPGGPVRRMPLKPNTR